MARYSEFEVTTPVEMSGADDFIADAQAIGSSILDRLEDKRLRIWSTGKVVDTVRHSLKTVDPKKLRYYHYSRVAEPAGMIPLTFLRLASRVDPNLMDKRSGEDLKSYVAEELYREIGSCSLDGVDLHFDYLDITKSAKYPNENIFVLRKLIDIDGESSQIDVLQLITDRINQRIEEIYPEFSELIPRNAGGLGGIGIDNSLPFARTEESNPDLLQEFRETFTSNLFDPEIVVRAGGLQISTVLN